jgi:hypothetical protein
MKLSLVILAWCLHGLLGLKFGAPKNSTAEQQPRSKVDLGLTDFEQNLTSLVGSGIQNVTTQKPWTSAMRDKLVANATHEVSICFEKWLAPIKDSIGKTWVALPQDEQRNAYIAQLRLGFQGVFAGSLGTIQRNLRLGLNRFEGLTKDPKLTGDALVELSETAVSESLLKEHCYSDGQSHNATKANPSAVVQHVALLQEAINEAFCIQPAIASVAHRLNDTMGLISMTMRFEAGAMSLTQRNQSQPTQEIRNEAIKKS